MVRTPARRPAAALALLVVLGACSANVSVGGSKSVDKAEVENQTAEQLAQQNNLPKPTVTCPGDLDAKVGATMECELVAQGETTKLPVHIAVDKVEGTDVHWNIEVGKAP